MIERSHLAKLRHALDRAPAIVLLGPRQVGKTTLAFKIKDERDALYLDLESDRDRARLDDAEGYLRSQSERLVILDEIQRMPELFTILRGLIDERRRAGIPSGHFLLLGSASPEILKKSSETLAGRTRFIDLPPIGPQETPDLNPDQIWLRGGFPESLLALDEPDSFDWRENFIRTFLERDLALLSPGTPSQTLSRLWTMLAYQQGGLFNASELARNLDITAPTVTRYVDLFSGAYVVRRLLPWIVNTGKRLTKSPRVYIRDSGITHALVGLQSLDQVLSHPVVGGSWEGFVIETLINSLELRESDYGFYRTSGGAELDLVFRHGNRLIGIEVKRSSAPKATRAFHAACDALKVDEGYIVYNGEEMFPLKNGGYAIGLKTLIEHLS